MSSVKIRRVVSATGLTYDMTMPLKGYPDMEEKGLTLDQVMANLLMYYEGRNPAAYGDDYGRVVIERARKYAPQPTGKRAEKRDITPGELERFKQEGSADGQAPLLSKPGEESETLDISVHSALQDANGRVLLKCPDCDKNFSGVLKALGEVTDIKEEPPDEGKTLCEVFEEEGLLEEKDDKDNDEGP